MLWEREQDATQRVARTSSSGVRFKSKRGNENNDGISSQTTATR